MVSIKQNISVGGTSAAVARLSSPPALLHSSQARGTNEAPPKPAIAIPKPAEIKFDAAEIRQNLKEAVGLLNEQVSSKKQGLGFRLEDSIDVPVVTVRNTQTGEVVRQIPNEVVIKVAQSIDGFKGLMLNQKA
jgi:flagellar protein FlaG